MVDKKTTILVAEDSRTQSVLLRSMLEKAGYRAVMTGNGKEALESIRNSPPDVIITDLDMPEMNGLELVEAVHSDFPNIPVILVTAVGSEAIAAEAMRKGAASYVPKRSLTDLIPTLQRLLAVAQSDRASAQLAEWATYSEVRFCLPNDGSLVAPMVAQIKRMVERFGLRDKGGALRVAMALDEALQNAIIHGNLEVSSQLRESEDTNAYFELAKERRLQAPYNERKVYVRAFMTKESAEISIRDDGPGFDPGKIPDPTDPAYLDRPCGRGLWLIHAFIDEVQHNGKGNEITMTLRRQTEEEED
ncbi:MAG TPA: response regulator [Planctomycetaceae bacterium]|nr:response regulator [Planctomycetaceae bacterium]